MKNLGKPSRLSGPSHLLKLVTNEFPNFAPAYDLFAEFLRHKTYDRSLCLKLLAVGRQTGGMSWEIRRLAILMLEHQVLKVDPNNLSEFDFLLRQLKLRTSGPGELVVNSVLKEGYSTTEFRPFVSEFRRKLERLNRVHDKVRGKATSESALRYFTEVSRDDCKLSLARYLFTPEEVVDEILRRLQVTEGVRDLDPDEPRHIATEARRALKLLPDYEASILQRLSETADVYWVSKTTRAEINSLVEYPLTTVVMVIKPPGSDIEFEIKRAGRQGLNSLNVIYARNGYTVAPSHRLDGGSMQWLLRYEATNGSKLARIYRLVHETEAPMGSYISRSTISSIPVPNDEAQTLTYFTRPEVFGARFREMRVAMKESVAAFRKEGYSTLPDLPGDLGLSAQFVGTVTPGQAILCGTTSFRLDKLDSYLSPNGPERYFTRGLKVEYSTHDAKVFADAVMEEILGCYRPPKVRYRSHDQYVTAAFGVPENRVNADRIYLSLLQQIAKFWGTLLAVRGYSRGESFVARNVGLRSFWDNGQWSVRVIFMDHDALVIPNSENGGFYAHGDLRNMALDERYIWERSNPQRFAASDVGRLLRIYRVGEALDVQGQELARVALKAAYKKTQHALLTRPKLQSLFHKGVIERLLDWDTLVDGYLRVNGNKSVATRWKNKMRKMLAEKGYREDTFDVYLEAMDKNRAFLERQSSLFELKTRKPGKKRVP
jgi:hypothetical protein